MCTGQEEIADETSIMSHRRSVSASASSSTTPIYNRSRPSSPLFDPKSYLRSSSPLGLDELTLESHSSGSTAVKQGSVKKTTFTTPVLDMEINDAIKLIREASLKSQDGLQGPFQIGWVAEDTYHRISTRLSTIYKLSWALSPSCEDAFRTTTDSRVLGLLLFWGDPSPLHDQLAANIQASIRSTSHLAACLVISAGGGDQVLNLPAGTRTRPSARPRQPIKNPDATWKRAPHATSDDRPLCVLEVAWGNESLILLHHEVIRWAASGTSAIGIKVWFGGKSGDTASKAATGSDVSVIFLCREANTTMTRVWSTTNPPAAEVSLTGTRREGTTPVLPMRLFSDNPTLQCLQCICPLASIARLTADYISRIKSVSTMPLSALSTTECTIADVQDAIDALQSHPQIASSTALQDALKEKISLYQLLQGTSTPAASPEDWL